MGLEVTAKQLKLNWLYYLWRHNYTFTLTLFFGCTYFKFRTFQYDQQDTSAWTGSNIHMILLKIIASYSGIQTDPSNITTWATKWRAYQTIIRITPTDTVTIKSPSGQTNFWPITLCLALKLTGHKQRNSVLNKTNFTCIYNTSRDVIQFILNLK